MSNVSLEAITNAIYGQESGHGKADTSKANYAGARGPMQVTASTFQGLKDKGLIPKNYDHANPEHTRDAGNRLVADLYTKYKGDASKVAAAYYAGEKAVRPDGSIADYRDRKNAKAPTTHQYVQQVLGRLGGEQVAVPATTPQPAPATVTSSWDTPMPGRALKPVALAAAQAPQYIESPAPLTGNVPLNRETIEAQAKADQEKTQKVEDTGFFDKVGPAFTQNTFLGSAMRAALRPDFEPTPGYALEPDRLAGMTADEQDFMLQAGSAEEAAFTEWEIKNRRADLETVNLSGTGVGIAATLFAGLPEGYITGMGAMRSLSLAKVGSAQLAAQGRGGAAIASAVAEGAGTNLGLTALQDTFDPYIGATDYGMALGFSWMDVALVAPSVFGGKAAKRAALEQAETIKDNSAAETLALRKQALDNLGPDARPEDLLTEVQRLESNGIRQTLSAGTGAIPEQRRLLPDTDPDVSDAQKAPAPELFATTATRKPIWEAIDEAGVTPVATRSGKEMLTELATKSPDTIEGQLAGRLMTAIGDDVPVFVMRREDISKINPGAERSHFDPSRNLVVLRDDAPPTVLTHELAHAASMFKLRAGAKGVTGDLHRIVEEITALRTHLQSRYAGSDSTTRYYLKDNDEFVAGLYSGKSAFTDFLKANKSPAAKSAFNAFVDIIRRLLGIPEGQMDAFTKALNLSEELISSPLVTRRVNTEGKVQPDIVQESPLDDPVAIRHGLSLMPATSPAQQAEVKAITELYRKAEAGRYKTDEKRLSKLMNTAAFQGAQGTANIMLRSVNPVVRMVAAELLESAGGAGGRRSTASIAKYLNEQAYLGNTLNEVESLYVAHRKALGVPAHEDFFGGRTREHFDRLIAEEIESRRPGAAKVDSPQTVKDAADALEKAYERMRQAQVSTKTIGWASLPGTSKGYMPHKMSPVKVRSMTMAQEKALHSALTDQFIQIEGFDFTFSDKLASKYLDRVKSRALGGFESPLGVHQVGSADIVEEALEQMGMTREQITAMMKKYMAGGAGHTKRRLQLDLNAEHDAGDGTTFRLMDLFDTNQFNLLRNQARRVSGEVALAGFGVMGKPGLKLLRKAMEYGADGQRLAANDPAIHAFDQVAAEFLGDTFGTQSRFVDRMMIANSLARLGGMGFTQFAEAINGVFHIGAMKTLDSLTAMPRLKGEIMALARGEQVSNPFLSSIERFTGAEFGTQAYKTVFPYDAPDRGVAYGQETLTMADRLLRGGQHVQGKLSLWRTIHATQQRGMAEGIVRKAAEFIKKGADDVALRDMGITPELQSILRKDIDRMATFDEAGNLKDFDLTKATDKAAATEFAQAVHRGVSQIIQGTFIGEQGRWVHDGMMRLFTQFRTFSLTSVEKQWARQVGNVGVYKALGMMLGAMSLAAPIYMARTYVSSIGRTDQEEYLEKQLTPENIARATLNYIAMSGLAGDFLDMTSAITGIGPSTGGRSGAGGQDFVGNVIAPSAALADDVYKAIQDTKEGTDPHQLVKTLPFNRLPFMIPAVNSLGD